MCLFTHTAGNIRVLALVERKAVRLELHLLSATKKKKLGTPNGVPSSFGCGDGI